MSRYVAAWSSARTVTDLRPAVDPDTGETIRRSITNPAEGLVIGGKQMPPAPMRLRDGTVVAPGETGEHVVMVGEQRWEFSLGFRDLETGDQVDHFGVSEDEFHKVHGRGEHKVEHRPVVDGEGRRLVSPHGQPLTEAVSLGQWEYELDGADNGLVVTVIDPETP